MDAVFKVFQEYAPVALALFFAIVLHEIAHGYVAFLCGDATAKKAGRLSLNPLKHVDPVGTVLLPLLFVATHAPFMFGWAKPVPVRFNELKRHKIDMVLVALAGPAMNFILATAALVVLDVFFRFAYTSITAVFFQASVLCNLSLMMFNLIPVLPLDGGRILAGLLPEKMSKAYGRTERWGFWVLLGVLVVVPTVGSWLGRDWNLVGMYLSAGLRFLLEQAEAVSAYFH